MNISRQLIFITAICYWPTKLKTITPLCIYEIGIVIYNRIYFPNQPETVLVYMLSYSLMCMIRRDIDLLVAEFSKISLYRIHGTFTVRPQI